MFVVSDTTPLISKMNRLVQLLSEQNRMADMIKAANNSAFQKELFKEFHL